MALLAAALDTPALAATPQTEIEQKGRRMIARLIHWIRVPLGLDPARWPVPASGYDRDPIPPRQPIEDLILADLAAAHAEMVDALLVGPLIGTEPTVEPIGIQNEPGVFTVPAYLDPGPFGFEAHYPVKKLAWYFPISIELLTGESKAVTYSPRQRRQIWRRKYITTPPRNAIRAVRLGLARWMGGQDLVSDILWRYGNDD